MSYIHTYKYNRYYIIMLLLRMHSYITYAFILTNVYERIVVYNTFHTLLTFR